MRRTGSSRARTGSCRARTLWPAALALAWLLASCTGTSEPRPPTLLVVGVAGGGTPQLALVEDAGPGATPRLSYLPASARTLNAPAVGLDFEDRGGGRPAAWVLTRSQSGSGAATQVTSYLQRFLVEDVDPAAPAAFAEDAGARIALALPGGGGVLTDPVITRPACPVAVQVSRLGRWALVLDDPARCGLNDYPVQWLVDTQDGTATRPGGDASLLAASPYTDQASGGERAYFLVSAPGGAQVFSTDFSSAAGWYRQARLYTSDVAFLDMGGSDMGVGDVVLVGLSSSTLASVDLGAPTAEPTPVALKVTATATSRLVVDPLGGATEVFVLASGTAALHRTPTTEQVATISVSAAAGAIDPETRYAYLVADGAVVIVDLLSGPDLDSDEALRSDRVAIAELVLPTSPAGERLGVVGWVRAAAPPAP